MRLLGVDTQSPLPVGFIISIVPLEPLHVTVALKGEYVRGDTIQEPPIVGNHHCTAREVEQGFFQRA